MSGVVSSVIMRTTIDIDDPILREVKSIHRKEGRSMGAVVSELLADALTRRRGLPKARPSLTWTSRPMKALVNLADKDAVYAALDADRS
jgi:Arc/MetJ family transcription regulator